MHDYPFCKLFCSSGAHPELASAQDFGGRAGAFLLATSMLNLCGDDRLGILFGSSESTSSMMTEDVFADACTFVASAIERPEHLLRIRFLSRLCLPPITPPRMYLPVLAIRGILFAYFEGDAENGAAAICFMSDPASRSSTGAVYFCAFFPTGHHIRSFLSQNFVIHRISTTVTVMNIPPIKGLAARYIYASNSLFPIPTTLSIEGERIVAASEFSPLDFPLSVNAARKLSCPERVPDGRNCFKIV